MGSNNGAVVEPSLDIPAVCVDLYSSFKQADMIMGPEPVMIVATDHGADVEASHFCSFSAYFDLVLATYGTDRFGYGLSRDFGESPRRIDAWTVPSLDELIAELRNDE